MSDAQRGSGSDALGKGTPQSRCTLCVVTRNRSHLLARCLLDGLQHFGAAGYPIVLVDQSSDDRTADLVMGVPGLRYFRSGPGLSVGRNAAVRAAGTSLLAFTDDDVRIFPGWIESIVAAFEDQPGIGAVCGRARNSRGELLPGGVEGVYRWPADPFSLGSGYNMSFRRQALADAGPFDEQLGAGGRFASSEDSDMFYRVLRCGWVVMCRDDIAVIHEDWRSHRTDFVLQFRYGVGSGAQTAKYVAVGDRDAGRLGLGRLGRQVRQISASALGGHPRMAAKEAGFVLGMAAGYLGRRIYRASP
jgi:GT2 family glycosyltransferase